MSPSEVKVPIITRIVFNKIRTHIDSDRDLVSVEMPHTGMFCTRTEAKYTVYQVKVKVQKAKVYYPYGTVM